MSYAAKTSVSIEKTEAEIKTLLRRYKADRFMSGEERGGAMMAFEMQDRRVIFRLPLPDPDAKEFSMTPGRGVARSSDARLAAWEQACRSRWRALFLCIKAKLESVDSGIETFEDAFLSHIVLADGSTVGEMAKPAIARIYSTGAMQPLLPPPARTSSEDGGGRDD